MSERAKDAALFLLRVVAGLLFLQHGGMKLFGWFGGEEVASFTQLWAAGMLEFWGGTAVLLGLWTRPVAFLLSGEMAVAYFQVHQPQAFWPIQNQGEPAVLFCFIFLLLAAHGGGRPSLDEALRGRRRTGRGLERELERRSVTLPPRTG